MLSRDFVLGLWRAAVTINQIIYMSHEKRFKNHKMKNQNLINPSHLYRGLVHWYMPIIDIAHCAHITYHKFLQNLTALMYVLFPLCCSFDDLL